MCLAPVDPDVGRWGWLLEAGLALLFCDLASSVSSHQLGIPVIFLLLVLVYVQIVVEGPFKCSSLRLCPL